MSDNVIVDTNVFVCILDLPGEDATRRDEVIAWLSSRSEAFRALVEGRPSVLATDGKVDRAMLRRQLVSDADFVNAMHLAGCASEKDIRKAILQPNGHIMIQTTDGKWG